MQLLLDKRRASAFFGDGAFRFCFVTFIPSMKRLFVALTVLTGILILIGVAKHSPSHSGGMLYIAVAAAVAFTAHCLKKRSASNRRRW